MRNILKKKNMSSTCNKVFAYSRNIGVILALFVLSSFTTSVMAQARVSLNFTNAPATEVFQEIKNQTQLSIVYNMSDLDLRKTVSIKAQNEELSSVLDKILSPLGLTYSMTNNSIVVSKKVAAAAATNSAPITVTGTVVDGNNVPLIGVTVRVQGTSQGTATDMDGKFSLRTDVGNTLNLTYVGYNPYDVRVANDRPLQITMVENVRVMEEVVVTALGIKRSEKSLTYNVQTLNTEAVNTVKTANFVSALSGKIAGVNIKTSSAGMGGSNKVVLRGAKSIAQNNNVLYVIDGIPIHNFQNGNLSSFYSGESGSEGIADINPEDIESMSVLSGASASALYGYQAANGAIIITTKRGAEGKARITISNQTTFSQPFILPKFQNKYGNRPGNYESWGEELTTSLGYEPTDFFNTGTAIQNTVSVSTGTKQNQTYVSVGTVNTAGIIPNSGYDRYNATFRNTALLLNDKLTIDLGFNYIRQEDQNLIAQGQYFNPLIAVYTYPRGLDFNPIRSYETFSEGRNIPIQNWPWGGGGLNMQNPYWMANRNIFTHDKDRYMFNASAKYDVAEWFDIAARVRFDNAHSDHQRKMYATTPALHAGGGSDEESKGYYGSFEGTERQTYADVIGNIKKDFGDFSIFINVGGSMEYTRYKYLGMGATLDKVPNYFHVNNIRRDESPFMTGDGWRQMTLSTFGSAEFGWKSRIYLTATDRIDFSSTLARMKTKYFSYPSVGLSAILSEFFEMPKFISYAKIRGSWAEVGNAIPRFISQQEYDFNAQSWSYEANAYKPIYNLDPEKTRSWEVGLDMRFFANKLRLTTSLYRTNTFNQTFSIGLPSSSGYRSQYIQTGNILNEGIEITLGGDVTAGKFKWTPTFTASANRNEIIDLGFWTNDEGIRVPVGDMQRSEVGSVQVRLTKGGTLGDFWTTSQLAHDFNGNIWVDADGNIATESTMEKVGTSLPKWNFGFHNTFSWNNIVLSAMVSARVGGLVVSPTQAILDSYGVSEASANMRDEGGKFINAMGQIDAETWYKTVGGIQGIYKYYMYDATNVRLQELSLGYILPSKWFNDVAKIQLSLVANNVLMIYSKAPFDPESTSTVNNYYQGIDYFMQPSLRNLGFSVKVDF